MSKKNKNLMKTVSSNFKLISTSSGVRVSQACDRCRIKKSNVMVNHLVVTVKKLVLNVKPVTDYRENRSPRVYPVFRSKSQRVRG